ncbi:arsenic transporter [Mucilaginibacter ginkgonis]|uniref:Arsenic transporter n=1 Tax=Mucilaginibacter ginkgonis TaxID=2682091 RepID=A0A6I4HYP9_9SPHI|nr:arsenic transporter [Mucilaginibacter ginkgonis]QQL49717.1 arsenic transporter [Mucilaginibacter ginkgonis]
MHSLIFIISFLAVAGILIRPFHLPEAVWPVLGSIVLITFQQISFRDGLNGISKGLDVYLFLTGMMLLAETSREVRLFDWLAAHATNAAKGSPARLFLLIYLVGIVVTVFLSNDATAVVLTPAVAAAARAAKVKNPLPFLLICAFIANAASFVLPIANPANLVIYGEHMPALSQWLSLYLVPSVVSIIATYILLKFTQRKQLGTSIENKIDVPELSPGGKTALGGIGVAAIVLLIASALNLQLGLPTIIVGVTISGIVVLISKQHPITIIKGVSWSVLPLVAGLFVIVEALNKTPLIHDITAMISTGAAHSITLVTCGSGIGIALVCNVVNNLPAGLIAGNIVQSGHLPGIVKQAVLIGVDLGPNLSVTGSLATILWLVALRRENLMCSAWQFLKIGAVVMGGALIATLGVLFFS